MRHDEALRVLTLIESKETALRKLAEIAQSDPFDFYRGADLAGLQLANQDLRGMNFDKADLSHCDLDGIKFDQGCFNETLLDDKYAGLKDPFEFYTAEVLAHDNTQILVFCRFRPHDLSAVIAGLYTNLTDFAASAGVSVNALRKARKGLTVAVETAKGIILSLHKKRDEFGPPVVFPEEAETLLRQPSIQFVSGGINMPFKHVSRERYAKLLDMRKEIQAIRKYIYSHEMQSMYRDTPEFLETMLEYYRRNRDRIEAQVDAESLTRTDGG